MISPGARLGPYEVIARLGAGGMGEVYRARDSRLNREVAVKVLPPEVASDADRRQRFEQEARAASALNHPGIVTVYDVGTSNGTFFITMELVEGETLRELLAAGPLSTRRTLELAGQVADALAKAHAAGIVHRDLKPENVIVSSDGFVKILDFGLAKLAEVPPGDQSHLPTVSPATAPGMVLGTVGYMSPEQASGRAVDFRSDQFSFGSILYEMIGGRRAFEHATAAETLAAIIRDEPQPLASRASATPPPVRWIAERCLAKDPKDRYASTSDLARDLKTVRERLSELSGSGAAGAFAAKPRRRPGWLAVTAAFLIGAAAAAIWLRTRNAPAEHPAPVIRPLTYTGRDYSPAVSGDGKTIAFVSERDGKKRIWLRQMAGGGEQALTNGPDDFPRFSPDGSMILFIRTTPGALPSLWRQNVVGGEPRRVVENAVYADWSPDGKQLAFIRWKFEGQQVVSGLWLAALDGSGAREIYSVRDQLTQPRFSPDGRRIVVSPQFQGGAPTSFQVFRVDGKEAPRVVAADVGAVSSPAWLGEDEIVYSQALSASGAVVGTPGRVVLHDIKSGKKQTLLFVTSSGYAMDVLGDDRLVFETASSGENLREMALTRPNPGQPRWLTHGQATDRQPSYSPDGEWIVFSSNRSGNLDLWEVSTKTGVIQRLTDDAAEDWDPGFTPDGKSLLWSSNRSGPFEIWIAGADGTNARQLTHDGADAENPTATPDGRWIYYSSGNPQKLGLWKIRSDGTQAARVVPGRMSTPEVSPDGRYVAYASIADGTLKVVRADDGSVVMTTSVAPSLFYATRQQGLLGRPRWLPGARAIAFVGRDENGVNGVFGQDFVPGTDTTKTRRKLGGFDTDSITESFGLSPDGTRLTIASVELVQSVVIAENVPRIKTIR